MVALAGCAHPTVFVGYAHRRAGVAPPSHLLTKRASSAPARLLRLWFYLIHCAATKSVDAARATAECGCTVQRAVHV